jgi:hypothetical protein
VELERASGCWLEAMFEVEAEVDPLARVRVIGELGNNDDTALLELCLV